MVKDDLGTRMKGYESVPRNFLIKRTPVIIRLDGKAFHTFTKGFGRPFDLVLQRTMQRTAQHLCENIHGCKLAYTQSDEISLLLTDYATLNTEAWINYNVQKMTSISASMATLAFNKFFKEEVENFDKSIIQQDFKTTLQHSKLSETYKNKFDKALFDSRAFNISKEEVCNYFIWRQKDAIRNSIQMVGQSEYSHKELHKVNCNDMIEKLKKEKNIDWNEFPKTLQRGSVITKNNVPREKGVRNPFYVDNELPVFSEDRNYIEQWV